MIINLQYNFDLNNLSPKLKSQKFFDLTGSIPVNDNIIRCKDLDRNDTLQIQSVESYIKFVEEFTKLKISKKKNIRDYKILGKPLIWFTPISEKHKLAHWGYNFFYFKELIANNFELFKDELSFFIVLPSNCRHLQGLFSEVLNYSIKRNLKITFYRNKNHSSLLYFFASTYHLIRNYGRLSKYIRTNRSKVSYNPNSELNLFVNKTLKYDLDLHEHYQCSKKLWPSAYIPFLGNIEDYTKFNCDESLTDFWNYLPTKWDIFKLLITIYTLYFRLSIPRKKYFFGNYLSITSHFIKKELSLGLINSQVFFSHIWLKKYFSSLNAKTNLFYSDEFYISGRLISSSIPDSKKNIIKTYGIQHGLFWNTHTVYSITDSELKTVSTSENDQLPIPDNFIVWGDYFKSTFLKNNSLNDKYVIVAGNLKYRTFIENIKPISVNKNLTLLWCTTALFIAKYEFSIICQFLKHSKYVNNIIVRAHPLHNLNALIEDINNHEFRDAFIISKNNSLKEDFSRSDVVLTSAHSTVFLDSIIFGKPTIRIKSDIYHSEDISIDRMLYNVYNSIEMSASINSILSTKEYDQSSIINSFNIRDTENLWNTIFVS